MGAWAAAPVNVLLVCLQYVWAAGHVQLQLHRVAGKRYRCLLPPMAEYELAQAHSMETQVRGAIGRPIS